MTTRVALRTLVVNRFKERTFRRMMLTFIPIILVLSGASLLAIQTRYITYATRANSLPAEMREVRLEFDQPVAGTGWHSPEGSTTWTSTTEATVELSLAVIPYRISFKAQSLTPQVRDSLILIVNGETIALEHTTQDGWMTFRGVIPEAAITQSGENTRLVFRVAGTAVSAEQGSSQDSRSLGLRFDWLQLSSVADVVQTPLLFGILVIATALATLVAMFSRDLYPHIKPVNVLFGALLVSLVISGLLTAAVIPRIPFRQLGYFGLYAIPLGLITIVFTPTPIVFGKQKTLIHHLQALWDNRILLQIWTRYNILSRYSQAFLGILWIILQPLATSMILAFVFSQILRHIETGGAPYISFYMAAVVAWTLFNQGLINGAGSLEGASRILQQVYFPREIIVLVKLGETLVDVSFVFIAMILINFVVGVYPNIHYIYLPILIVIQIALTLGLMLFVSYLSMMIRDVPQLIQIVLRFMFYLTPIIYPASAIPERFNALLLLNPIAPLVTAYRDIILYNSAPNFVTLYYPTVMAGVLLYSGYMFFKKYEKRVTDFI